MMAANPPEFRAQPLGYELRSDDGEMPTLVGNLAVFEEWTVKEVRMAEFGPVTFPAYAGATSGLRSLTDRMLAERIDTEDLDCLAQMIALGAGYIAEQDEGEDTVPRMEAILASLADLV